MDDDSQLVTVLVEAAAAGNAKAWQEIVERYSMLLVRVIRRYRLSSAEVEDVAQTVWLRLVEHLGELREPRALPRWIVTTAQREALRVVTVGRRTVPHDPLDDVWVTADTDDADADLLRLERHEALLAALAELPTRQRDLLLLIIADPPLSYAEIHRRTGIPIGSIGPTRARALDRLRQTEMLRAVLTDSDGSVAAGGDKRDQAALG